MTLHRQNKLWEGSRMFLPEHKEALLHHYLEKKRVPSPELDEQQQEYLHYTLQEAWVHKKPIQISYVTTYEYKTSSGVIDHIDITNGIIHVSNAQKSKKISLNALIHVD